MNGKRFCVKSMTQTGKMICIKGHVHFLYNGETRTDCPYCDKELKLSGYGITPDGTKVDINSPEFKLNEYKSVTITEMLTMEEVNSRYPLNNLSCKPLSKNTQPPGAIKKD